MKHLIQLRLITIQKWCISEIEAGGSVDFTCTDEHEDCILSAVSDGMIDEVDIESILYSDSENCFQCSDGYAEIPSRDQIKKKKKDVTTQTDLTISNVFDYIKDCRAKMEVIDKDLKQPVQPFSEKYFVNDDMSSFIHVCLIIMSCILFLSMQMENA